MAERHTLRLDSSISLSLYLLRRMEKLTNHALDESTRLLKAFADPVRLRLLNLLSGDRDEICVCHLHEALGLPQPTVSRHLAYLRKHGLVAGRKEGLWVHYRLAKPKAGLHRISSVASTAASETRTSSARIASGSIVRSLAAAARTDFLTFFASLYSLCP